MPPKKAYSRKNDWDYWTENEQNRGKHICDSCLIIDLYRNKKWEFHKLIANKEKRQLFRKYIYDGTIK